jgi:predicted ABC-type ATPase
LSYQQTIEKARKNGYDVTLIFFWLNNVNLAVERVKIRVTEGGYNIPVDTIKRRYHKGIKNLLSIFILLCDNWLIFDNSNEEHARIAEKFKGEKVVIHNKTIWNLIKKDK